MARARDRVVPAKAGTQGRSAAGGAAPTLDPGLRRGDDRFLSSLPGSTRHSIRAGREMHLKYRTAPEAVLERTQ
jgi:hypothetical protein